MTLNDYILVNRNGTLYKAKLTALSSVVLLTKARDDYYDYLSNLSSSIETLTSTIEFSLYSKDEMKSSFVTKETIASLDQNGSIVQTTEADEALLAFKSKSELSNDATTCWYNTQLEKCANNIVEGFIHSKGMMQQKLDGSNIGNYSNITTAEAIVKFGLKNI